MPKHSPLRRGPSRRLIRFTLTILVTGLCTAYILWKIDVGQSAHLIGQAELAYFLLAVGIMAATIWPMAWRWQLLLRAKGIEDGLSWLTRAYFVSYTAGQVIPGSVGGDAVRIYETAKRHPGRTGDIAGSVLLERALGAAATLLLAAIGFGISIGEYDVGPYLWIELGFVVALLVAGILLFSRQARPLLRRLAPLLRRFWLERPARSVYEAVHAYRRHGRLLAGVCFLTVVVQAVRVLAIWATGKAVGIDLSPRVYFVMGPLLFLVMLLPVTISGLAVRESFFVNFLGKLSVPADKAFAAGFVFFGVTLGMSLVGAAIYGWEAVRGLRPARQAGP
jgi:glycosyltransferase 2 family protein